MNILGWGCDFWHFNHLIFSAAEGGGQEAEAEAAAVAAGQFWGGGGRPVIFII
jgi:hypothetical protein